MLLPVYAGLAIGAGIAAGYARLRPNAAATVVLTLVVVQFVLLLYNPAAQIPSPHAVTAGDEVVAELRALPGPVLLTGQPWLLRRAGRPDDVSAHASALQDVLRANAGPAARQLAGELVSALRTHRYCSVIVDTPAVFSALPAILGRYYRHTSDLRMAHDLAPVTGYPIRAAEIWTPRGGSACGGDAAVVGVKTARPRAVSSG